MNNTNNCKVTIEYDGFTGIAKDASIKENIIKTIKGILDVNGEIEVVILSKEDTFNMVYSH